MNTSTSTLVLIRASWALRWARKRHWWNGRLKGAGWWGGFETGQQTDAFWSIDPSFPTTGTQKRCRVPVCCSVCCCFSVSLSCRLLATSFVPLVVLLWGCQTIAPELALFATSRYVLLIIFTSHWYSTHEALLFTTRLLLPKRIREKAGAGKWRAWNSLDYVSSSVQLSFHITKSIMDDGILFGPIVNVIADRKRRTLDQTAEAQQWVGRERSIHQVDDKECESSQLVLHSRAHQTSICNSHKRVVSTVRRLFCFPYNRRPTSRRLIVTMAGW